MSDIDILHRMISEKSKIQPSKRNTVTLTEANEKDSIVEISGIPSNSIIIKIDQFPPPEHFFSCIKGECKRADYAIIAESGKRKRILFIELKKTNDLEKEIILQFKGAECVMAYCKGIAEFFYDAKDLLKDFKPRFVAFYHTSIRKRKTRIHRKASKHNTPEKLLKIQWPKRMQYNQLVG